MAGIRMQQDVPDRGRLQVWVNTRLQGRPIAGAKVSVSYSGDPGNVLEEVRTDSDGEKSRAGSAHTSGGVQPGTERESAVLGNIR